MFPCYAYDPVLFAHFDGGSDDHAAPSDPVILVLALALTTLCYGLLFAVA